MKLNRFLSLPFISLGTYMGLVPLVLVLRKLLEIRQRNNNLRSDVSFSYSLTHVCRRPSMS